MKQWLTRIAAMAVGLAAVACADAPGTPLAPRDEVVAAAKGGNGKKNQADNSDITSLKDTLDRTKYKVAGAQWVRPLTAPVSASATIGPAGGWLELPATGLYVYVPAGAVSVPTAFKATAAPGKLVAYDFEPAGSTFAIPLFIVQDRSFISTPSTLSNLLSASAVPQLGYFTDASALDEATSTAIASELRTPLSLSTIAYSVFPVWHFSGYIVCWGRTNSE